MSNEFWVEISSFRQSRTLLRHCCQCGPGLTAHNLTPDKRGVISVDITLDWSQLVRVFAPSVLGVVHSTVAVVSKRACDSSRSPLSVYSELRPVIPLHYTLKWTLYLLFIYLFIYY